MNVTSKDSDTTTATDANNTLKFTSSATDGCTPINQSELNKEHDDNRFNVTPNTTGCVLFDDSN